MKILTTIINTMTKHTHKDDQTNSEERVDKFKKHLKIENPLLYESIGYDTHVAIKTYLEKYENGVQIGKDEREEFVDALIHANKKFENDGE